MNDIIIAGIDETDGLLKKTYRHFYHPDLNYSWEGTYMIGDNKYDVNNIITSSELSSVCINNGSVDLGKDEAVKEKLTSADVLVFVSEPNTSLVFTCNVLSNLSKLDFSKVRLVIFANSYSDSLELGFEEFYKNSLTTLFPNALILGFGKQNNGQFDTIIQLINSKCVSEFIHSQQKLDVATIIEDENFIKLLSQAQSSDYFWCNKDYVGGDVLKTYELEKYTFLTKKLKEVVSSWWCYKDFIPYVIGCEKLTCDNLKNVEKVTSEDKSFYNNAVLVTRDGNKSIQGKIHYSFVNKYLDSQFNKSYESFDYKGFLKNQHVGVDCSGLVSPVLYETVEGIKKDSNYKETVKSLDQSNQMWGIKRHDAVVIKEKGSIVVKSVKNVRPGDIMRTCKNYAGAFHIRLVIDVKHHDDGSVEIHTFESSSINGLQKKKYLFKYEGDSQSYNLIVDDKSNKEFFIKTKITEVTQNSYSGQYVEGQLIVNTTHYALPEYMDKIIKSNDENGFDHVIDTYGNTYYFRRPKFLHSLVSRLNSKSAPVVTDSEPKEGSMDLLTPDEKQQITELAADIIEIGIKQIKSYKIVEYVKKTVVNTFISDFSRLGKFAQAASIYSYKKKRFDDLVDNMNKVTDNLIDTWDLLPDILLDYLKKYGGIMPSDELISKIHEDVFGVKYDKQVVDLANDYFINYMTAYRCNEFKHYIKSRMDSIFIKFKESSPVVINPHADFVSNDELIIKRYYESEDVRQSMLSVFSYIVDFGIADFKDLETNTSEKPSTKQIEEKINSLLDLLDSVIQYSDELRNRAGIYSLKAFGFDFPSLIEFEKAAIKESEYNGGLLKAFCCVILSIGIGSIVGSIAVLGAGAKFALGVAADTLFSSVGVDIFDLYSSKISTKEKVQQIVFNAIISSLFSAGASKLMPVGLKYVKLKFSQIKEFFAGFAVMLRKEIAVFFRVGLEESFATIRNILIKLRVEIDDLLKLVDADKLSEALEAVRNNKNLLIKFSEVAEEVSPTVNKIEELSKKSSLIDSEIEELKAQAIGSKYYDDFGADKYYLDWNEESLKKMSDIDKNGLFFSEQARLKKHNKALIDAELNNQKSILEAQLKQQSLNKAFNQKMSTLEFWDDFLKTFDVDKISELLTNAEKQLNQLESLNVMVKKADDAMNLAKQKLDDALKAINKSLDDKSAPSSLLDAYESSYKNLQSLAEDHAAKLNDYLNFLGDFGGDINKIDALVTVLSPLIYNALMLSVGSTSVTSELLKDKSVEEVVTSNLNNNLSQKYSLPQDENEATYISNFLNSLEDSVFVNFTISSFLKNVEEVKVIEFIDDFADALNVVGYHANSPKEEYMYVTSCSILINNLFNSKKISQDQLNTCYNRWKEGGRIYVKFILKKLLDYGFVVYGSKNKSYVFEFFVQKTLVSKEDSLIVPEAEKLVKLANALLVAGTIDTEITSLFKKKDIAGLDSYFHVSSGVSGRAH